MFLRKDVIKLTMPVIAEQAFLMIMGVINAIMAGHLGKEVVSAIGMVDSINNIFIAFFSALAVGGTVVVAHYSGLKNYKSANEAARHTLLAGLLLSVAVTLVIFIFRHSLIVMLFGSAEKDVANNSLMYLGITLLTYPLIALTSVACGVLRGAGDTKTPMKITIMMNFFNIVLSYVLIYGFKFGSVHFQIEIPGFGLRGAAYGIAAARTIGAMLVTLVLFRGSKIIKLTIDRTFRPDFEILKSIFGVGLPASIESLLFNGGKLITQIFIVSMGTASIAANYIAGSVFGLINIPGAALSIAATTLIGQHMGRGEKEEARATSIYLVKAASLCLLIACAVIFPLSRLMASAYTGNAEVVEISAFLIRTSLISMPLLWALSFILPAALKGAGDARYTLIVSVISMWTFRIALSYVIGITLKQGVAGIWYGMYIDWLFRSVLFYIRLRRGKWMRNVVVKRLDEAM